MLKISKASLLRRLALVLIVSLIGLPILALIVAFGLRAWVNGIYGTRIYTRAAEVPAHHVAIVFGAAVRGNRPTPVLADRVEAAVELYRAGRVQKLIMTGDNRLVGYNEPAAMIAYAQEMGVPAQDLVADYAGRRTYDSCYRARDIFGVQNAVLVTQNFHLDRALFICDRLGLEVVGYAADRRTYPGYRWVWWLREVPATALALWDTAVRKPVPVLGEPIPISD
jgi:SanA protein